MSTRKERWYYRVQRKRLLRNRIRNMWRCLKILFSWFKKRMCTYTTYIDEAGNTHTDLQNPVQPYFVIAAVSVPNNKKKLLMELYQQEFDRVKRPDEKEIKGRIWVKKEPKQQALKNIINGLKAQDCIISVVVVDKMRMIMPLAVNKFFDYFLNGSKDMRWRDMEYARKTAEYYNGQLTSDEKIKVYQAFDDPKEQTYREAIRVLKGKALDQSWKDMLDCSLANIPELLSEEETDGNNVLSPAASHSPNLTSYFALVNMQIERLRHKGGTFILFDSCKQCNEDFRQVYEWMNKAKDDVQIDDRTIHAWDCVKGFDVDDSRKESALQFADIVASSVYFMLLSKKQGKQLNSYEQYIFDFVLDLQNKELYWEV